jgi:ankyrin repeat-rich membrane spanning protein
MAVVPGIVNAPGGASDERASLAERFAMLASAGVDLDARVQGETPLMWAIRKGPIEAVRALLEAGADVYAASREGWVALHVAAACGRAEAVPELIGGMAELPDYERFQGRNIVVGEGAKQGWNALHLAAAAGSEKHAQTLRVIATYPGGMNDRTPAGESPLLLAVRANSALAIHALLDCEVDARAAVDLKHGKAGKTALHAACEWGKSVAGVALLTCGANPRATMSDGSQPLHLAARLHPGMPVHRRDLAEALVDFHADVNQKNNQGFTPLDIARNAGNDPVCALLKSRGAVGDGGAFTPYNP